MIKNQFKKTITQNLGHEPTLAQENAIDQLSDFLTERDANRVFILRGYAGTGKTTLLGALNKALKTMSRDMVLMAPTGRAAKVLSENCAQDAYTIHKTIYRQKSSKDGFGEFVLNRNTRKDTLFVVDEASMVGDNTLESSIFGSGNLLQDLLYFVFNDKNCTLLLCGDTAQLPPIGSDTSPALQPALFETRGIRVFQAVLTDVVRQNLQSGIIHNATQLRTDMEQCPDKIPILKTSGFNDIEAIKGTDLIELLDDAYRKFGTTNTIVISRTNRRINKYNQGIRQRILWHESELSPGDLLMVVKNNYFWLENNQTEGFIANGDTCELLRILRYDDRYGFRFAHVRLRMLEGRGEELETILLLDTLSSESASMSAEDNKRLFYSILEDYTEVKVAKDRYRMVRENPYYNALQVKFAYAVTCHKAQGGQWDVVFLDQDFFNEGMMGLEYLRWLYTGLTRATKKLYLVNFNTRFLEAMDD